MSLDLCITPDGELDVVGFAFYANDCFDGYRKSFPHWTAEEVQARAMTLALGRYESELRSFNFRSGRYLSEVIDHAARELMTDGRIV